MELSGRLLAQRAWDPGSIPDTYKDKSERKPSADVRKYLTGFSLDQLQL